MQILTKNDLLKKMKFDNLIGIVLMSLITGLFVFFGLWTLQNSTVFAILIFLFSSLLSIVLFKLVIARFTMSEQNLSISKDFLVSKEKKLLRYGNQEGEFSYALKFNRIGEIECNSERYDSMNADQYYYIVYSKGDPNPISIYSVNEYELDEGLNKICKDLS